MSSTSPFCSYLWSGDATASSLVLQPIPQLGEFRCYAVLVCQTVSGKLWEQKPINMCALTRYGKLTFSGRGARLNKQTPRKWSEGENIKAFHVHYQSMFVLALVRPWTASSCARPQCIKSDIVNLLWIAFQDLQQLQLVLIFIWKCQRKVLRNRKSGFCRQIKAPSHYWQFTSFKIYDKGIA